MRSSAAFGRLPMGSVAVLLSMLCIVSCAKEYRSSEAVPRWEWTEQRSNLDYKIEYLLERDRFAEALSLADSIIAVTYRDPRVLEQRARALAGLGRDEEALLHFEEAIIGDYEACESHLNFAVFLMERGKTGRAVTEFNVAKRFCAGENMAVIHRNLAVVNIKKGNTKRALNEVFAGLRLTPEDPYLLGLEAMLIADKNPARAETLFVRLYEKQELAPDMLHPYGVLLVKAGKPSDAIEVLERAAAHSPEDSEIRLNLGIAHERTGNYRDAEEILRPLADGENGERAVRELARMLYRTGRFEDALGYYTGLPRSAEVMDRIAMCHLELGDLDEALAWSRKAVEERPDWPTAMSNLAVILAARGELDEAAALLERVLLIDPDHATARNNLERLRSAMEEAKK